jgi:4-amino-4-deoxy-L-arabinose transferase-like glycosyltransferase
MTVSSANRAPGLSPWVEAALVFCGALGFILLLAPSAPFAKELGACEMGAVRDVMAGHVILPYFTPAEMTHAPPFYWWMAAISAKLLGWNEFALRLPAIIASALGCALVFAWLAGTMSRRAGLWAAAALLFCHFYADAARQPRMDSMLAMLVTGAAVSLERAIAGERRRRAVYLVAAALFMGLGTLTKGPLGVLLPGLVIALYLLVRGRFRELFAPGLIASFAGGFAVGLAWYLAAYHVGGEQFYQWQVVTNLWLRFIPASAGGKGFCDNPFYYFVPHTIGGFLPWTLYLPALGVWLWKRGRAIAEPVIFALCWFVAIFVFFSASTGKCLVYILPVFPPLAALTGCLIDQVTERGEEETAVAKTFALGGAVIAAGELVITVLTLCLLIFGVPAKLPVKLHLSDRRFLLIFSMFAGRLAPQFVLWLAASTAGALAALIALRGSRLRAHAIGVAVIAAAGTLFWFGTMNPADARMRGFKQFGHEAASLLPLGAKLDFPGMPDCGLVFYLDRPIAEEVAPGCRQGTGAPRYFIFERDRFDRLSAGLRECLKPIAESPSIIRGDSRLLVVEQAPPKPAQGVFP